MAFPKLLQKLFGNSGAGPLLRSDILPAATATTPGAVKIGSGVNVSEDGTISAQEVDLSPYAKSADVSSSYLPLAGGTMTGDVSFSSSDSRIAALKDSVHEGIDIRSAPDINSGAFIGLYNKDSSAESGYFRIGAITNSSNEAVLLGTPGGVLTWCNERVATRHIYPYEASYANQNPKQGEVCVIRGSTDVSPNNGFILSFHTDPERCGQLYVGDNSSTGVYFRGKNDGSWGEWQRLLSPNSFNEINGQGLSQGTFIAPGNGVVVCYAYSSGWGGGDIFVNGRHMGGQFGKECGGVMYAIVKKGDTVELTASNATTWWATYYPFRG
jgi:hypothetical protein